MKTYEVGDKVWFQNRACEILDPATMYIPRVLLPCEVFISYEDQRFTVDSRLLFPYKRAEDYAIGSILAYNKDDLVYGKLLVKTCGRYWHVARADRGNMGSWSDGEVNMGLRPGGSITVVLDNEEN